MPDIVLIHPAMQANMRHKRILPLGLLYLASYLRRRQPRLKIRVIDAHIENLTPDQTVQQILAEGAPTIVGIGFWTPHAPFAYRLSALLKQHAPSTLRVFGGVHPTMMPQEATEHADVCVLHEGETPFAALVDAVTSSDSWTEIPGIAWREHGQVRSNPTAPFIAELDSLPFPAWDLVRIAKYNTPLHIVGGPRLPIIMSRGCPYNCTFCVSPYLWKRTVRWRSAGNVVDEMAAAIKLYGLNQYHFWDDNLLLDSRIVEDLCQEILNRGLAIKWVGLSRAAHVVKHRSLLRLMKRAGCVGIEIGIESADVEALKNLHKEQTTSEVEAALRYQTEAGLTPLYTLMAFNPGETASGYYLQTKFINQSLNSKGGHKLYVGQFCTAYPGTAFFTEALKLGQLLAEGWQDYHHHNIKFLPFSLLNDKPKVTVPRLDLRRQFVMLLESYLWRYDAYPDPTNRTAVLRRMLQERRALKYLFSAATGERSLENLAQSIASLRFWDAKESLRVTAFLVMIGAQIGIFYSNDGNLTKELQPEEIRFNRRGPNLVYRALNLADRVFNLFQRGKDR